MIHRIAAQDLHLSVSKTFALRRGQIAAAVARLRERLRVLPCFEAAVSGIQLYSNEERTRSFIGLSLDQGAARMQVQQTEVSLRTEVSQSNRCLTYGCLCACRASHAP